MDDFGGTPILGNPQLSIVIVVHLSGPNFCSTPQVARCARIDVDKFERNHHSGDVDIVRLLIFIFIYSLAIKHSKSKSGWWLGHPSEKYEFVNWDDEIPNWMGTFKKCSHHSPPTRNPKNQRGILLKRISIHKSGGFSIRHLFDDTLWGIHGWDHTRSTFRVHGQDPSGTLASRKVTSNWFPNKLPILFHCWLLIVDSYPHSLGVLDTWLIDIPISWYTLFCWHIVGTCWYSNVRCLG